MDARMSLFIRGLGLSLLCFLPLAFALGILLWQVASRKARRRYPLHGGIQRPAGESTRLQIEELNDSLVHTLLWMVMVPSVLVMAATAVESALWIRVAISLLSAAAGSIVLWRLYARLSSYSLGFDGERLVGTELQALERRGMRVFHDVPFDGFNIDHMVVGDWGVAVIETKTRRIAAGTASGAQAPVTFDGKRLHFPFGTDDYGLDQTRRARAATAAWLAGELRREIPVSGILVLPGWSVRTEGRHEIEVLGHSVVAAHLASFEAPLLSAQERTWILSMLEKKCLLPLGPTKAD
jgi:hypothetical protein